MFENVAGDRPWFMDHIDERVQPRRQEAVAERAFDVIRQDSELPDRHLMAVSLLLGQYTEVRFGEFKPGVPLAPSQFGEVGLHVVPHEVDQVVDTVNTTVNQATTCQDLTPVERPNRYVGSVDYNEKNMLGTYIERIRLNPILALEEQRDLGAVIQQGRRAHEELELIADGDLPIATMGELNLQFAEGKAAHEKLVVASLPFAIHIAKFYAGKGVEFDDLIQEANLTLMDAAEKWRPDGRAAFTTYAGVALNRKLQRAVNEQSTTIRIPVHVWDDMREYRAAMRIHKDKFGVLPTDDEIQAALELSYGRMERVKYGFAAARPMSPLEPYITEPAPEESDDEDHGIWPRTIRNLDETGYLHVEEQIYAEKLKDEVAEVLATLSEREAGVIRLRFGMTDGEPKTLDEIGAIYGVTRERIRQLEDKTLKKLRNPDRSERLRDFYEDNEDTE